MNIHLKIKPGSRMNQLLSDPDNNFIVKIKAPAMDGKANDELIRFFSEILKIPRSAITLKRGQISRYKTIEVEMLSDEEINKRLAKALNQ